MTKEKQVRKTYPRKTMHPKEGMHKVFIRFAYVLTTSSVICVEHLRNRTGGCLYRNLGAPDSRV